jgi:hypothetical protein
LNRKRQSWTNWGRSQAEHCCHQSGNLNNVAKQVAKRNILQQEIVANRQGKVAELNKVALQKPKMSNVAWHETNLNKGEPQKVENVNNVAKQELEWNHVTRN